MLDHTREPKKVLREIYRVLKENGLMFFTVNIRTKWGAFLHSILAKLNIDKGHPHSCSYGNIRHVLEDSKFIILSEKYEDYHKTKRAYLEKKEIKNIIKAYVEVVEILYIAVCCKK